MSITKVPAQLEAALVREALLKKQVAELQAELELAHRIIKKGANTLEEVAYVFDIKEVAYVVE